MNNFIHFLAGSILAVVGGAACAEAPVLTLSNGDAQVELSVEEMREIGSREVKTSTIWTEGVQLFEGVPLLDLLAHVGVSDGVVSAAAVNDYAVEIPLADATSAEAIVAFARNGAPMSLREKGPLWVIYPYDSDPAYRTEDIYSRSIWQLNRINAK